MTALRATPRLVVVGAALWTLSLVLGGWMGWFMRPDGFCAPSSAVLIFMIDSAVMLATGGILGVSTGKEFRCRGMHLWSAAVLGLICAVLIVVATFYSATTMKNIVMLATKLYQ